MKRIVILITLSLVVSVCGGEGSSNQVNEVVDEQPQATEDNLSVSEMNQIIIHLMKKQMKNLLQKKKT